MFSCFIAPLSGKVTYVRNQMLANAGSFGVEPAEYDNAGNIMKKGKNSRYEFGGHLKTTLNWQINKNVNLTSKFLTFTQFLSITKKKY